MHEIRLLKLSRMRRVTENCKRHALSNNILLSVLLWTVLHVAVDDLNCWRDLNIAPFNRFYTFTSMLRVHFLKYILVLCFAISRK